MYLYDFASTTTSFIAHVGFIVVSWVIYLKVLLPMLVSWVIYLKVINHNSDTFLIRINEKDIL